MGDAFSDLRIALYNRIVWYLKQFLPLHYRTTYWENGRKHFVVWQMWFGRCFNVHDVLVCEHEEGKA